MEINLWAKISGNTRELDPGITIYPFPQLFRASQCGKLP
jgi:hypothetical protein